MNVQDFLKEWKAIRTAAGDQAAVPVLEQWVTLRKDIATQETKNKFWGDLFGGITESLKREIAKLAPEQQAALSPVSDVLAGLEEAMAKHRQQHGATEQSG